MSKSDVAISVGNISTVSIGWYTEPWLVEINEAISSNVPVINVLVPEIRV